MSKNYLSYSLYLVLMVVGALVAFSFIPEEVTSKLGLRRIDILSDIRIEQDSLSIDTLSLPLVQAPVFEDTCRTGLVCFEDYSEDQTGMEAFYTALCGMDTLGRPVRIAFYGDSYIEGDIFSADLRANLQACLGGAGVGLVGAASSTAGFRQTVKHTFSGWSSHTLVDSLKVDYSNMGVGGTYFVPQTNSWTRYTGIKKQSLDTVQRARVLYRLESGKAELLCKVNGRKPGKIILSAAKGVQCLDIVDSLGIGSIQLNFPPAEGLQVFGVSLEDSTGILVDNFSLRGMPGPSLKAIPRRTLEDFDRHLQYDLIILEYGLNAMTSKVTDYKRYQDEMCKTVEHLKAAFPRTSILLISVGDRSMKKGGEYVTMPGIMAMVAYQQAICAETGVVFWNMFEAMGGAGSMPRMVSAKPPRANKDYTHLTFAGGKYLGDILSETILYEKERYERRAKHRE